MWKNTWGIKEGIMTCAGLLVIGLILHLMTGGVDWNSFSWPLNLCVAVAYLVVWGIERSVFSVIGENSRNALKIKWFSCA